MVSFGEVSVSTFTTLAEDAPNAAVLTDSTPQDNGLNLVSRGSQKEKSDSPIQNTSQVGKSGNYSLENRLAREEEKRLLKLQNVEERQEKAKKKANLESKKLQMEFERKQREHEERMRQVEEKFQLRLTEAALESSSGEIFDKSTQSSETESDDEFSPKELHEEYDEYAENIKVQLPEVERPSSSFLKTDSYSSRLTKYRQHYSSGEDIENPFEQQTRIQSTPLGSRDRQFLPDRYAYSNSFLSPRYNGNDIFSTPINKSNRSLPKLKLREFDGNPLDWPEWSGMFLSTIHSSSISRDEKMSHLKTLLVGKAKQAVNGMGYSGTMYDQAWNTLPHHIVSSQLAKIQNFPQVRFSDLLSLIEFADTVSTFVNLLQQFAYWNDLFSSRNLNIAVSKLPLDTKRRWFAFIEAPTKAKRIPNLVEFNNWLQEEVQVHERLVHCAPTSSKFETQTTKFGKKPDFKKSPKPSESAFSSNDDKTRTENKCPIEGSNHRVWNCDKFRNMKINENGYNVVKEKKLCFCCLADNHAAKNCPRKKNGGVDGCEKTHNKLLHYKKRSENLKPINKTEVTNLTSNVESIRGLMQIARARIFGDEGQFEDTLTVCDTGSTQTWVDEELWEKLELRGEPVSLNVTGIHGTQIITCRAVQATVGPANCMQDKGKLLTIHSQKNSEIGPSVYNVQEMKEKYPYLKCVGFKQIDLKKVATILGQNAYELIRPVEYKNGGENKQWAIKLPLGWTVSGPVPINHLKLSAACPVDNDDDMKLAEVVKKWWDMESYGTLKVADKRTKEDKLATEFLNSTIKFNGERYEVGLLWNGEQAALSSNFSSALGQLRGLHRRLQTDELLKVKYTETINSDLSKGYISLLSSSDLAATINQQLWYVPHHPVLNPHKPDKVRRVCNAASKFRATSLNDMLLAGADLLPSLMGILERFRENRYALSANIEEIFLQVEVRPEDQKFLRFLWSDENDQLVTISTIDMYLALNCLQLVQTLRYKDVQRTMLKIQIELVT